MPNSLRRYGLTWLVCLWLLLWTGILLMKPTPLSLRRYWSTPVHATPSIALEGKSKTSDKENAYMFYITSNSYACSALINIHRLRTDFATTHRILALVSPELSSEYISALEETNTTVIIRDPPPIHSQSAVYYTNCLLKLLSFQIYEMEPSIERVLTLDADQPIMKNLDHVFDLPETDLAAPRTYWLSDNTAISSTLLLILPDERSWARVKQTIDNIEHNIYDMDIVNGLFNKTAILLPGSYATLNSHWEDWTVPNWYRSRMISAGDMSNLESGPVSTNDQNEVMYSESKHGEQREIGVAEDVMSEKLFDLQEQVYVLHYTAVGKPWSYDMKHLRSPTLTPCFLGTVESLEDGSNGTLSQGRD